MARKWLKELRTSKGLTQQRMADMLGMSRQYYHLIESGNRKATLDIELAAEIAHIFRISLKKIYNNEKGVQA
jgi:putative transcriptional regulator|nr:MAG TPA: helix-turn-helix domain protein [Caudoviricetes sp.]